jgi:hypothetical protein
MIDSSIYRTKKETTCCCCCCYTATAATAATATADGSSSSSSSSSSGVVRISTTPIIGIADTAAADFLYPIQLLTFLLCREDDIWECSAT